MTIAELKEKNITELTKIARELDLPGSSVSAANVTRLEDVERQYILSVMENSGWRVRGRGGAAEVLGLKPTTLDSKLLKLNIRRGHIQGGHDT